MKGIAGQFADWVRTKPADEAYDYCDANTCALTRFAEEFGYVHLFRRGCLHGAVPDHLLNALRNQPGEPNSFGALAKRLEEAGL